MTTVGTAHGYHLVKSNDQWLIGRPLLSAPGVRKLSDEEAAPLQDKIDRVELSPQARATPQDSAPRLLTMSVDIAALTEKAGKIQALYEKQDALRLNDPTTDDAFLTQFRAGIDKLFAAAKKLLAATDKVPPYAVIYNKQGKEVGRIFQDGGFVTTDPRFHGLHAAVADGQRSIIDGKHDRYEAIRKALGSTGRIELTGVDVDPQTLFPDLRKAMQTARDDLDALRNDRQKRLDAYHAAENAIRELWA